MFASTSTTFDLLGRMARVKRQALLLFFVSGTVMALLALLLPTSKAPDPQVGQQLFVLAGALSLGGALLVWRRPAAMRNERIGWLWMLLGNLCPLLAILGETLMFGSQSAAMVILWPMVYAAGFLRRRLLWWQVAFSTLCIAVMSYFKSKYLLHGEGFIIDVIALAVPVAFTGLAIAFFRDAAESEAQELSRMVSTDPLTGLSNRRELPKQFAEMLQSASAGAGVAVVMLDLDHFKTINDRYGHHVGDSVLQNFALVLRSHARPSDLLARLGGEEFMWITTAADTRELIFRVERLREGFSRAESEKAVTVSAGVAYWSDAKSGEAKHLPELMQSADQALYRAKAEGRNRMCLNDWPQPLQ